jgi:hypothetical protein
MRAKDNPFRVSRVNEIKYLFSDTDWPEVMNRLEELDFRAAIVGNHGSGKSKLLNEFEPRLIEKGFVIQRLFLNQEKRKFPPGFLSEFFSELTSNTIILFDGAEQLSNIAWNRFKKKALKAKGLIITCHEPGMLPALVETSSSIEVFRKILMQIAPDEVPGLESKLEPLFNKHSGNLRDAIRELYDIYT